MGSEVEIAAGLGGMLVSVELLVLKQIPVV